MKAISIFLAFFSSFSVQALTLIEEGDSLQLNGIIEAGNDIEIEAVLNKNPRIKTFIFNDCMGGDVSTGFLISKIIKAKRINTIVKGQCQSSCAYAFLAGTKRSFFSGIGTHAILIHAARNTNENKDVVRVLNPALMRYLSVLTDGKLTPEIKDLIANSKSQSQGVVFVEYNYFVHKAQRAYYCDGSENGNLGKCRVLSNASPFALGIVN